MTQGPQTLQVLLYDGVRYPDRPYGLADGAARYLGPVTPTSMLSHDEWINIDVTSPASPPAPTPLPSTAPRVILDQDISSDWDDVGAIAVLHALADLGECQIIGMMVSSHNGASALCMDAINTYYGRPDIPIGVRPDVGGNGSYPATVASEFPHDLASSAQCTPAATLYRQLLAASTDHSVTIVTTGYLDNLQALLATGPDRISPLDGPSLVARKVKVLSCMGGSYPSGGEFNFGVAKDAAFAVVNNWPAAAIYSGDEIGTPLASGGRLTSQPAGSPIRRVWELQGGADHSSYDQTAVYAAVRADEGMWDVNRVGRNTVAKDGSNRWVTDSDPSGLQDQGYLRETGRSVAQAAIDALMMAKPKVSSMSSSVPTMPSYLRSTMTTPTSVRLQWTSNSYNESSFTVELGTNGVYSSSVRLPAGTTSHTFTDLSTTANTWCRVRADNDQGSSPWTSVWLYSGWTEVNLDGGGVSPSLYARFRPCDLRWNRGGDFRPRHVAVNNDSAHRQDVTLNVDVGATGAQGSFHVYLFYSDSDNWYRLNVGSSTCYFEKKVAGTTSRIGPEAPVANNIGNGSFLQRWVVRSARGVLSYVVDGTPTLSVLDTPSFSGGLIGLGGTARTPLWENIHFIKG